MKSKKELAAKIVELLGGKENITFATHCITRLRFHLKDEGKVDKVALEQLDGVMGTTVQSGQFQVIIGPAVKEVYREVEPLLGTQEQPVEKKEKFSYKLILDTLTAIIAPIIPAFSAAGMLKCVCLILTTVGLAKGTEGAYVMFDFVSDVAFYFLPILIAWSASKRFKVDTGLAICVAGALLYPSFVSLVDAGESLTFFGIQVPMYSYASTIFPALLGVWLLSKVYKVVDKIVKMDAIRLLVVPLVSLGITIPVTFLVLAPIGNWGANLLVNVFTWMLNTTGPFAGLVIGALMPIMTLTGLHQSLSPIELMEVTNYGFTMILTIEFLHNLAEAGAALGTAVATKNKEMKATAAETGFTAFIGISEPALYTIMVRDRRAMLSAMIGNGVGGFISILFGVKYYSFIWPNIFSIPSALGGEKPLMNVVWLLVAGAAAFVTAFVLPTILRKVGKEKAEETVDVQEAVQIGSPVDGSVMELEQVPDETFSRGICGQGAAVVPENGEVYAPCDGTICAAMPHAVGIRTISGTEILVHVGIDTVNLQGNGLRQLKKDGEQVKKGELLIQFDKTELEKKGYNCTCMIVCTSGKPKEILTAGEVRKGETLFSC